MSHSVGSIRSSWSARLATGNELYRIKTFEGDNRLAVHTLAFSPDGRTLAWAGPEDGIVRLTEAATGKERRQLTGHRGEVNSLAFAGAGRMLVSGGADTTALVWDLMALGRCAAGAAHRDDARRMLGRSGQRQCRPRLHRLTPPGRRAGPAVRLLAQHLPPTAAPAPERVARLLADLDSDDFAVRDAADRQLAALGDTVLVALRATFAKPASLELRLRVERLTARLEIPQGEALRSLRAVGGAGVSRYTAGAGLVAGAGRGCRIGTADARSADRIGAAEAVRSLTPPRHGIVLRRAAVAVRAAADTLTNRRGGIGAALQTARDHAIRDHRNLGGAAGGLTA